MLKQLSFLIALTILAIPLVAFADEDSHLFDDLDGDGISDSQESQDAAQGTTDDSSTEEPPSDETPPDSGA